MTFEQKRNCSDPEIISRPRSHYFIDPNTDRIFTLSDEQVKRIEDVIAKINEDLKEMKGYYVTLDDLIATLYESNK